MHDNKRYIGSKTDKTKLLQRLHNKRGIDRFLTVWFFFYCYCYKFYVDILETFYLNLIIIM